MTQDNNKDDPKSGVSETNDASSVQSSDLACKMPSVHQDKQDNAEALDALDRITELVSDAFNGNPTIMEFLEKDEATIRTALKAFGGGE